MYFCILIDFRYIEFLIKSGLISLPRKPVSRPQIQPDHMKMNKSCVKSCNKEKCQQLREKVANHKHKINVSKGSDNLKSKDNHSGGYSSRVCPLISKQKFICKSKYCCGCCNIKDHLKSDYLPQQNHIAKISENDDGNISEYYLSDDKETLTEDHNEVTQPSIENQPKYQYPLKGSLKLNIGPYPQILSSAGSSGATGNQYTATVSRNLDISHCRNLGEASNYLESQSGWQEVCDKEKKLLVGGEINCQQNAERNVVRIEGPGMACDITRYRVVHSQVNSGFVDNK